MFCKEEDNFEETVEAKPISVETIIRGKDLWVSDWHKVDLSFTLKHRLQDYFSLASFPIVLQGDIPRWCNALAATFNGAVYLDSSILNTDIHFLESILAHELAHIKQCEARHQNSSVDVISIVEDQSLEEEAAQASACFIAGNSKSPLLTRVVSEAWQNRPILLCQAFGWMNQLTLQLPHNWVPPAALGGAVNVQYAAQMCRNEIHPTRHAALQRARLLAGIRPNRRAKRTYHFTIAPAWNEGTSIRAGVPGPGGAAREGQYYDYGKGPAGRLLIVEHINDPNSTVTVAGAVHLPTPHFHICTYGQHDIAYRNWVQAHKLPGAAPQIPQAYDPETVYMPYIPAGPGNYNAITQGGNLRTYELDGRFGEVGGNGHHIYY